MRFKNILLAILVALLTFPSYSQNLDSLKALLSKSNGSARINLLYELAREYVYIDTVTGLQYALKGYQEATEAKDTFGLIANGRIIAKTMRWLGENDSAASLLRTILPLTEVADPVARQYLDEVAKTAEDLSVNISNYFLSRNTTSLV